MTTHRIRTIVRRYLPAELLALAGMFAGWWLGTQWTQSPWLLAGIVTVAENLGFYGYLTVSVWREQTPQNPNLLRRAQRTVLLLGAEFGPAEVFDSLLIRPALMTAAILGLHSTGWGVLTGSYAADAVFWSVAGASYLLTVKFGWRHRRVELVRAVHPAQAPSDLSPDAFLARPAVAKALALQGTPVLFLEPDAVARRYGELRRALPYADIHYALKANPHEAIIETLIGCGASFEVASVRELDALLDRHVDASRILYTHPVKSPADIRYAVGCGVRTFVVDAAGEVDKLAQYDVSVLIRLAVDSSAAQIDLSAKFGASRALARDLVLAAHEAGLTVDGLTFHVGSQQCDVAAYAAAVTAALDLMEELSDRVPMTTLDIGGGFPVAYDRPVPSIDAIAATITPLLAPHLPGLRVIAEPGRFLAAEAMTLVCGVVGSAERNGQPWYYLDDGVHGSYSNVLQEGLRPPMRPPVWGSMATSVLAGPTCDSIDVVAAGIMLPPLEPGDRIVSPTMGAYTAVTANGFNGIAATPIVALPAVRHLNAVRPSATAEGGRRPLRAVAQRAAEPST
ncbi:type III PLP-dependent enzyme [Branchiibius cervicis]|uniref:ornithine decarboxylase n=1 Tax=Branchiibius cervicis TaxID=908252 RepID=A0ABW2AQS2_9MICO